MIAPQQEKVLRVFDFVSQQQTDRLQRLLAPVHVIAQEQIVGFGREAPVLEQAQQICVLAVDVAWNWSEGGENTKAITTYTSTERIRSIILTANLQWGLQFKQDRLLQENLT